MQILPGFGKYLDALGEQGVVFRVTAVNSPGNPVDSPGNLVNSSGNLVNSQTNLFHSLSKSFHSPTNLFDSPTNNAVFSIGELFYGIVRHDFWTSIPFYRTTCHFSVVAWSFCWTTQCDSQSV